MKLYQVVYMEEGDSEKYLTVGTSIAEVEKREREKILEKYGTLLYLFAYEIAEVDGHKIIIE